MLELAVDMTALLNGDIFIRHVAANARAGADNQIASFDGAFYCARQAGILSYDRALNLAGWSLNKRQASDVANDFAVNMEVNFGFDIAGDYNAVSDDGEA